MEPLKQNELAQAIKKMRTKSDKRIDRMRSIIKKIQEPQQILKGSQGDSFHWKGEATATTPYRKNDVVHFDGSTYVATDTVVGFSLDSPVWHLMTAKGADGAKGRAGNDGRDGLNGAEGKRGAAGRKGSQGIQGVMGLIWRGQYRLGVSYVVGDVVGLHGSAYVCIGDTEQSPPAGFGWEVLAVQGEQGVRGMKGEKGTDGTTDAGMLTGTTLAENVVTSSLTTVGTLTSLRVINPISGSITGNAATATTATSATTATTAGTVTTAAQPTITSVGTLTSINTSGVITGTNTTASTSSTTGAVIVAGGAGIAKDSYINGLIVGVGGTGAGISATNTAFGVNALGNSTGTNCLGIGNAAGYSNSGGNVTAYGNSACQSNSGTQVVGIGGSTLANNTASNCVGVGHAAMVNNSGTESVGIGVWTIGTLGAGSSGTHNVGIGHQAGSVNTTGARGTFIGRNSGVANTTGVDNTFVGSTSGDSCTDGTLNVCVGSNADLAASGNTNSIVIGASAVGLGSNTTVIGTSSTTETKLFGQLTLDATACISAASATALALKTVVPAGTGVTPTIQIICPSSATALTSGTAAQNVFSPVGFDTITVQASTTYMFDGLYIIKTTGGVTHTISMSFALSGGASITNCSWTTLSHAQAAPPVVTAAIVQYMQLFAAVAGGAVNATNTTAFNIVKFQGIMRVNAAGSVVPQITFSAAPGGTNTLEIGSYLSFYPIGSNTIDSVGTAIG